MDNQFLLETPDACTVKTAAFYGYFTSALSRLTPLADQLLICQEYANNAGLFIHPMHMYTDSHAWGKQSFNRTGFAALQQAAQSSSKPFDYVLIDDLGRCPRRFAAVEKFTKLLQLHGIDVRFISQQLDSKDVFFDLDLELHMMPPHQFTARRLKYSAQVAIK